jgi:serine/threonine-protein kinase
MSRLVPARLLAALRRGDAPSIDDASDFAPESRGRVRVAAALGTGGYAIFTLVELLRGAGKAPLERSIDLTHDLIGLVLCAGLWIALLTRSLRDRHALAIALAMEVMLVALISATVPWAAFIRTAHVSSLTWAVPIIITSALLVPTRPATTLWVSGLCGVTIPAGLWLLAARGSIVLSPSDLLHSAATAGVAVGIATVASRTMYGARQQIAAARMVGSYELVERLGQGGMGEVWKARHLMLARPAAVKLILPEALQGPMEQRDEVMKRFAREAQVTASLRSPHTVELFDFGTTAAGTLYYAMELLDGMNLEHFVYRFGPVEPRRAVHWLRQACHSLGEAHARGLVHRDIKPANLFVCRYGRDADFIKILDFGLTKSAAAGSDAGSTRGGQRVGTPGYMAPEQVFGLVIDPRADLYALGCVGYWLIAGEKPFESDDAGELMRQHAQIEAPPLSGRAKQAVPARLEAVIMGCLSKDAASRPADADALSAALESALDREAWGEAEAVEWWARELGGGSPG